MFHYIYVLLRARFACTRYFTVVGILERKKESDMLLEAMLPCFFRGITNFTGF